MAKYIDADALKRWIQAECNPYGAPTLDYASSVKIMERIDKMPAADVEAARHDLIDRAKKYAADMEQLYTDVCADFRERTGQNYICGSCEYGDCVYIGADGDYCGECPGFESDECFVLSDEIKREIWEIVDIVSGAKMDGGSE